MTDTTDLTNPYTQDQLRKAISDCELPKAPDIILLQAGGVYLGDVCRQLLATIQREAEYRSIFRRCVDIIGFHNGDDSEKVEAIRRTMLQAPHIKEETSNGRFDE